MTTELGLVQHPDPILSRASRAVGAPDGAVLALAAAMEGLMGRAGGIGLAAVQVGIPLRLFVARLPGLPPGLPPAVIDPEVSWASPDVTVGAEGCLSIPGLVFAVPRPAAIRLACTLADGRRAELELRGLHARVALHEADHLDGRLVVDLGTVVADRRQAPAA